MAAAERTNRARRTWCFVVATAVLVLLLPALDAASPKNKKEEDSYTIGGVLSGYESEKHFQETIEVSVPASLVPGIDHCGRDGICSRTLLIGAGGVLLFMSIRT